jgi:hypothetical protein
VYISLLYYEALLFKIREGCGAIGILPYGLRYTVLNVAAPTLKNWN